MKANTNINAERINSFFFIFRKYLEPVKPDLHILINNTGSHLSSFTFYRVIGGIEPGPFAKFAITFRATNHLTTSYPNTNVKLADESN
jgi:hypothetical protein